jgi:hypothetical protein
VTLAWPDARTEGAAVTDEQPPVTTARAVIEESYHSRGRRAPHEEVYASGEVVTETLDPSWWPAHYRHKYEPGWRPWGWDRG